jgi:hypothetical protein
MFGTTLVPADDSVRGGGGGGNRDLHRAPRVSYDDLGSLVPRHAALYL